MTKNQIKIGGLYLARVSGKLTSVRVDSISERPDYNGRTRTTYNLTNTKTGRSCAAHSAAKFRSAVSETMAKAINAIE